LIANPSPTIAEIAFTCCAMNSAGFSASNVIFDGHWVAPLCHS
jgi:hypothetical protein